MCEWALLEEIFMDCVGEWCNPTSNDITYIKNSFFEIESFWTSNVNEFDDPSLIILGEAPLYGKGKSYIYNPNSKVTSFLRPTDFPDIKKNGNEKSSLLALMAQYRIAIVDLMPFALPFPSQPNKNYRSMPRELYSRLIRTCFLNYSVHKINHLLSKNPSAKLVIRYKALETQELQDIIVANIRKLNVEKPNIYNIYSNNYRVNKTKFHFLINSDAEI